mgnify:FL=1
MPTPKQFITQAIEMETFFEDEEPTFEEFMKYPPFSTLMSDDFTVPKMIELYRDGNLIFVDYQKIVDWTTKEKIHMNVNFFTKQREDVVFRLVNFEAQKFDEIDPVSINNLHDILMKVEWNDYQTQEPTQSQGELRRCQFLNLTTEEESHFANFLNRILGNMTHTELFPDGKQYLYVQYAPRRYDLYTTPYLKIYEPFNTVFPSWVVKRLTTLFESTKV